MLSTLFGNNSTKPCFRLRGLVLFYFILPFVLGISVGSCMAYQHRFVFTILFDHMLHVF